MNVEWDLMSGSHSACKSNGATAGGATFNGHVEWEHIDGRKCGRQQEGTLAHTDLVVFLLLLLLFVVVVAHG